MSTTPRLFPAAVSALWFFAFALPAAANPRPLPITYPHAQLAEGEAELEQFVDLTPVRARSATTGEPAWYGLTQFATEFEYGLTPRLELGLYVTLAPGAASDFADVPKAMDGNGMKQRLRYQLAEPFAWPVDVSVYGEVSENEREIEAEAKIILERRFGRARLMVNLTGEREFYYDGTHDLVLAPSGGLTFEVTPSVQPGIEWWMNAEYPEEDAPSPRPFELGPHQYVGPTVLFLFGRLWWTTGVYLRATDRHHTLAPGEGFGRVWVRSVVGVGL